MSECLVRVGASRWFHQSAVNCNAVNKSLLSKLRKKTGYPFINCRKALEQHDNDIEQAEKWLRQEAQKLGLAKASKLEGRPMSQGLIGLITDSESATMIEVNCETDFVAKNSKFHNLVSQLMLRCRQHCKNIPDSKVSLSSEQVNNVVIDGQSLSDAVAMEIGNIGENMLLRRAVHFKSLPPTFIGSYIHSSGPDMQGDQGCIMGRYGTVVSCQKSADCEQNDAMPLDEFTKCLSRHIIGMNPKSIGGVDDKPSENENDETKLIFQEFLNDPNVTVGEALKENCIEVLDFTRYECGEDLPEAKD